jgi:two-component system NtrC family sensor kinase
MRFYPGLVQLIQFGLMARTRVLVLIFMIVLPFLAQGQMPCYDCSLDSLRMEARNTKDPAQKVSLLVSAIEANDNLDPAPVAADIQDFDDLLEANKAKHTVNPEPYLAQRQAYVFWKEGQLPQALGKLQEAVTLFDKEHKIIVGVLLKMRIIYNKLRQQKEKLVYYTARVEYYRVHGPVQNIAACYHSIAGFHSYTGNPDAAISYYLRAAQVFQGFYDKYYYNEFAVSGSRYLQWGNYERSRSLLEKSLPWYEKMSGHDDLAFIYSTLASVWLLKGDISKASEFVDKETQHSVVPITRGIAAIDAARIELKRGRLPEAFQYLYKAKALRDSAGLSLTSTFPDLEMDYYLFRYFDQAQQYTEAEPALLAAYQTAVNEQAADLELKYLRALGEFYARRQNFAEAQKYTTRYFALGDEQGERTRGQRVAQFESEQKDQEAAVRINSLKQDQAVQAARLAQRNKIIWAGGIGLLLISGLFIFSYRQLHLNRRILLKLKNTQSQLIQSEKMASLGELTAGIAHEIQNPLNFVNNFAEVSAELTTELREELAAGKPAEASAIATDLESNLQKIVHHGKRADSIVKGMLEHSRSTGTTKEPVDINAMVDEYLRLSYHGLRARDKSFNCALETHYDDGAGTAVVNGQEIGRVLMNLFTNAFYALGQRRKSADASYSPVLSVTTKREGQTVHISISDNGSGIPPEVLGKIFQPFFTTKPTGEGTGLGLSLSYDIITKGHGGKLTVVSEKGEGTEFRIEIPG